ncbi:MAG: hypothetical protein CVU91_13500 [Firmicutes bacterium HGW-Firmicutes-16]|nr:MAG: hypothetical protein CVU91_13500 [Firmicutes bacterium HGW-Firmicutes-16]
MSSFDNEESMTSIYFSRVSLFAAGVGVADGGAMVAGVGVGDGDGAGAAVPHAVRSRINAIAKGSSFLIQ